MENKKFKWPITKLTNWDKNPRSITESNFKRLKKQILELGEYKPYGVNYGQKNRLLDSFQSHL